MPLFNAAPAVPVLLSGSPCERGRAQAARAGVSESQVRTAVLGRVEEARAAGLIDADGLRYVEAQRAFLTANDPDTMAELAGIAEGFGVPEDDLFVHQHLTVLRDLKTGAHIDTDGCSTWAVGDSEDGPLVVKNRDFSGSHLGVQRVFLHEGPDIATGRMICVGSAGSPGAYSSGINAAGLALVDNHVGTNHHGVGWLRYFAMTRILATCRTVDEAISFIAARPHAGGGNLILADRSGATAAIELGTGSSGIEKGAASWRTNHFVTANMADCNLLEHGDRIDDNSSIRFDFLSRMVPNRRWSVEAAAALMATHAEDGAGMAPLCQHPDHDGSQTISSVIYRCDKASLHFLEGNPCSGEWQLFEMTV
ncbi:C45 family autoproteolytic acyltransferase/hydolase [Ciceribacter thiooxidans]|uniref:C45 family autoproteolytic acyltransferase/hydrolase n=1 Tax=Ciceribacter thiooxidans TaxID=1969821 RepID=A0ABV7ICQ2_9HYPH